MKPPLAPDPTPTPEGARILDQLEAAFRKYTIQQSEHEYVALALYAAYTHFAECFDYAPRLLLTSAEKRSGKTVTLDVLSNLVANRFLTANATTAAIFRSIQAAHESGQLITLLFDEADTVFGTKFATEKGEELRGLLNAGFRRGTPTYRCEGVGTAQQVKEYSTFAPAVLAGIGSMPETITDRAVNIRLRRKKASETAAPYRIKFAEPELAGIRKQLETWAQTARTLVAQASPDTSGIISDRAQDLYEPLLAVAEIAGGTWVVKGLAAARHLANPNEKNSTADLSEGIELLEEIRNVIPLIQGPYAETATLIQLLSSQEESRWNEELLTGRKMANLLKPYQVFPGKAPGSKKRAYKIDKLHDAFERYLEAAA